MDANEYAKSKQIIEECPPEDLDGLINTLDELRTKALDKGNMDDADCYKELMRFALKR